MIRELNSTHPSSQSPYVKTVALVKSGVCIGSKSGSFETVPTRDLLLNQMRLTCAQAPILQQKVTRGVSWLVQFTYGAHP
jgi:hypothetical protein